MFVIHKKDVESHEGKTFTGKVNLERFLVAQQDEGVRLTVVHFEDGALTHWHEHPGEQILYVLDGVGRVGDEQNQWKLKPGDVVYTGPGEKHWHGAAPGHSMTHISITTVGPPRWYDEAPE